MIRKGNIIKPKSDTGKPLPTFSTVNKLWYQNWFHEETNNQNK